MLRLLHNVLVVLLPCQPRAYGVDLQYKGTIVDVKVMSVLWAVEERYPRAGAALIAVLGVR